MCHFPSLRSVSKPYNPMLSVLTPLICLILVIYLIYLLVLPAIHAWISVLWQVITWTITGLLMIRNKFECRLKQNTTITYFYWKSPHQIFQYNFVLNVLNMHHLLLSCTIQFIILPAHPISSRGVRFHHKFRSFSKAIPCRMLHFKQWLKPMYIRC